MVQYTLTDQQASTQHQKPVYTSPPFPDQQTGIQQQQKFRAASSHSYRMYAVYGIEQYKIEKTDYSTTQYSTVRHITIQCNTLQYNTIQNNTIQYNIVLYCIALYSSVLYCNVM